MPLNDIRQEKRVFLTGGTGLIGSLVAEELRTLGFEVYSLVRRSDAAVGSGVHRMPGDLFDTDGINRMLEEVRPTHLLNLAWCATGDYLMSDLNHRFRDAGMELLRAFRKHGGKRVIYAGTCFEYEFKDGLLAEGDATKPETVYAACKDELRREAMHFCAGEGLSFGWGRIFYVYGCNEYPKRLTPALISALCRNERFSIKNSQLKRDYVYARDVAGAFAAFLDSGVEGVVNICTGKAISLGDYARMIASRLGREHLLDLACEPTDQPALIVGNNARLTNEVGFRVRHGIDSALDEILGAMSIGS